MKSNLSLEEKGLGLTGAEAVAEAMRQIEPGVVPIYPITPQTPIIEKFAEFVASGRIKSEIITAESEHSVMSMAIGASLAGVRTSTASSSVGLALMYEMLNIASGMRLPIVMNVANRALSAPINIHCDHSDSMGVRDAGWIQIYSETAQEAYDNNLLATKLAEHPEVFLPVMVMQDGFLTSHLLEKVELLLDEEVKDFVGEYAYPDSVFSSKKPTTFGPLVLPEHFFSIKVKQAEAMTMAKKVYQEVGAELSKITGLNYPAVETFQVEKDTEAVIVVMSSSAGTAKAVARQLSKKGQKVGVVKVRLFRPFPYEELGEILKNIKKIAVLDRTFSLGSFPPLYSEVVNTFHLTVKRFGQQIQSYVFGLGGRDLRERDIREVYRELLRDKFSTETKYLNLYP